MRSSAKALGAWLVCAAALCGTARAQDHEQLWDVEGRRLFLSCSGERHGGAVILEAGRGRTSTDWAKVQPEVAKFTQVCSYDRAGTGRSEPKLVGPPPPEDAGQMVEDLHRLLEAAAVKPPYVLVGHSLGGLLVRIYQTRYPHEVQSLVLLDPVHEEGLWRALDIDPNAVQGVSLAPEDIRRGGSLPPRETSTWHTDVPLIVLRHGRTIEGPPELKAKSPQFEKMWVDLDEDLARRSKYGQVRVAEKSGHFIQLDQPDLVITAIHDMWGGGPVGPGK